MQAERGELARLERQALKLGPVPRHQLHDAVRRGVDVFPGVRVNGEVRDVRAGKREGTGCCPAQGEVILERELADGLGRAAGGGCC